MSLAHNPSIATNGLIMYYDMNNTQKSWKGSPTTNLITYPQADWNGSSFALTYDYKGNGVGNATQTFDTYDHMLIVGKVLTLENSGKLPLLFLHSSLRNINELKN
mgnify:CR=1 FL=1